MRLFSNVWSENTALFERLMEIHSNSPKLYYGFKLLKYKENNKKMCNTFDHNFKNIPLYIYTEKGIIRKVIFCIIRWCPYFKNCKNGAYNPFCDKTLHMSLEQSLKCIEYKILCDTLTRKPL